MKTLVRANVDRYAKNQNGSNALHMAVKRDSLIVLKELISTDYDVNIPKNNGVTALGIAALTDNQRHFTLLMDAGADPAFSNERGIGALYLAVKGKSKVLVQYLVNLQVPIFTPEPLRVDNSPIFYAVRTNFMEAVEIMADQGVDKLNFMQNSQGHNPMTYAASLKHFEMVNYLTGRGMLVDVEDNDGKTVLLRALEAYDQGLAAKLLHRGADINITNREGKTALSILV